MSRKIYNKKRASGECDCGCEQAKYTEILVDNEFSGFVINAGIVTWVGPEKRENRVIASTADRKFFNDKIF